MYEKAEKDDELHPAEIQDVMYLVSLRRLSEDR